MQVAAYLFCHLELRPGYTQKKKQNKKKPSDKYSLWHILSASKVDTFFIPL